MRHDYKAYNEIISSRVPADEVARDYGLNLRKDGRCRCIFCDGSRGDTLRIYPGDRGYYCFRCHESGGTVNLYMKLTGAGFRQAIEDLNEQYGVGLPLHGGDQHAVEKARREAEERKRKRTEERARKMALFEAYLDAADAVWIMEHNRKETAPQDASEPWRQRFVVALKYLDEMRDYRDRLFDELFRGT